MQGGPFNQQEAAEGEEGEAEEYICRRTRKACPGNATLAREAKPRTKELN